MVDAARIAKIKDDFRQSIADDDPYDVIRDLIEGLESVGDIAREHSRSVSNLIVVMQAAHIEWVHGDGAESAMGWIENTLDGPGLIPSREDAYGKEAQAYFDANRPDPMPQCFCGRPSNIEWMQQGFCSHAHYQQAKDAAGFSQPGKGGK